MGRFTVVVGLVGAFIIAFVLVPLFHGGTAATVGLAATATAASGGLALPLIAGIAFLAAISLAAFSWYKRNSNDNSVSVITKDCVVLESEKAINKAGNGKDYNAEQNNTASNTSGNSTCGPFFSPGANVNKTTPTNNSTLQLSSP
ncbi:MAG: hypothetical protein V4700_00650 [Pseudomonadota bacterium]